MKHSNRPASSKVKSSKPSTSTTRKQKKIFQVSSSSLTLEKEEKKVTTIPIYCYECGKIIMKSGLSFSCEHVICVNCVCVKLLSSSLKEIVKEPVSIKCKCGGSILTTYEKLLKILFVADQCMVHGEKHNCDLCDFWASEIGKVYRCSIHKEDLVQYCKECKISICDICYQNYHQEHPIISLNDFAKEVEEIREFKLRNSNFHSFSAQLQRMQKLYDNDITKEYINVVNNIDEIMLKLTNMKKQFILAIEQEREKGKKIFKMIKFIYYYYYKSLEIKPNNYQLLEFLHHNKYEISSFEFKPSKDFNSNLIRARDAVETIDKIMYETKINLRNGISLQTSNFVGHDGYVFSIIQVNQNFLLSCSEDKKIIVWDLVANSKYLEKVKAHNSAIYSLCNVPHKNMFASGSFCEIKLWDSNKFEEVFTLKGHTNYITNLKVLQTSNHYHEALFYLASGGFDKTIKIWCLEQRICRYTLSGHTGNVNSIVSLDTASLSMATCSYDKTIKIWSTEEETCLYTIEAHDTPVYSLILLRDGRLVSGGYKDIKFWDIKRRTCTNSFNERNMGVYYFVQVDECRLASCSFKAINFWDIVDNKWIYALAGHMNFVTCLCLLSDGRLASGSDDKIVKVWE